MVVKKTLAWLSVLILFSAGLYAAVLRVSEFGGLNTDDNPLFLNKQTPDAEDVVTDNGSALEPRSGYIQFSTEPSRNLYSFYVSNGNKYLITQSSGFVKATLGGSTFEIQIATVDPNVSTYYSGLGDKLFFTNTTDGLKYWDTNTTASVGLIAKFIVTHKGRLWAGGVPGDERTIYVSEYLDGTNFNLSSDPVDTDPTRLSVQGALDDILTGFYASFDDKMMWFKQRSFGGVLGSRRSAFQSREYSNNVGTAYPDSIKNCDGMLRWLGNDRVVYEFDGEKYYPINNDIDSYMDTIEQGDLNLRQWLQTTASDWNRGTLGVGIDTTTSIGSVGLAAGTTSSFSVFLATGTERSGINRDAMYATHITSQTGAFALMFVASQALALDKVTMTFKYKSNVVESYRSWVTLHQGATCPAPVVLDTATTIVSETISTLGRLVTVTTNYFFQQSTSTDKRLTAGNTYWFVMHTTITSQNLTPTTSGYGPGNQYTFEVPGITSVTAFLAGGTGGAGGGSGSFVKSSMTVTPYTSFLITAANVSQNNSADIRIGGSGGFSDRVLVAGGGGGAGAGGKVGGNGGYPEGTAGQDNGSQTGGGGGTQSAGGAGGSGSPSGQNGQISNGGQTGGRLIYGGGGYFGGGGGGGDAVNYAAAGGGSGYTAFGSNILTTGTWTQTSTATIWFVEHAEFYAGELESPNLSSTTLVYTSSFTTTPEGSSYKTGSYSGSFQVYMTTVVVVSTFTSPIFNAGTKFNQWGTIGLDDTRTGRGSIVYTIFTDSDTNIDVYSSSTYIANQVVSNGQTPTIDPAQYISIRADFDRGSVLSSNTAVLNAITINFSEGSSIRTFSEYIDRRYWIAVAVSSDTNNKVLVYDRNRQWHRYNILVSAIINYSGTFYFGNTSGIFQADYGNNDNGSVINSYYKTKSFAPSGTDSYSIFEKLFVTATNSPATLNTIFYVNEYQTPISMPNYLMSTQSGYQNFKLPFNADDLNQGKIISFKWSVSSAENWQLINANLYYSPTPEPQE